MNKFKKLGFVTILVQIINLIPFIIVALYFDKVVYGEFAANISIISILGITSVLKLDIYNIQKQKNYKFQQILKYLIFIWSLFYFILAYNDLVVFLGLITIISIGLYDYTAHNLLQNNLINNFNKFRITRALLIVLLYNLFWIFDVSVSLLLIIEILSKIIPFIIFYPHQKSADNFIFSDVFNLFKITFSWFINNSVILLIPFILSKNVGLEELGWYYIFFKGINQVEIAFASTFNQYLISESNNSLLDGHIKKLFIYSLALLLSILVLGGFLIFGISYFFDFYSDLFLFAIVITFFSGFGSPFYVVLNKLKMSDFQLHWDVSRFIIFLLILFLSMQYDFRFFLFGFPLLLLITYSWLHIKIIRSQNLN